MRQGNGRCSDVSVGCQPMRRRPAAVGWEIDQATARGLEPLAAQLGCWAGAQGCWRAAPAGLADWPCRAPGFARAPRRRSRGFLSSLLVVGAVVHLIDLQYQRVVSKTRKVARGAGRGVVRLGHARRATRLHGLQPARALCRDLRPWQQQHQQCLLTSCIAPL